MESLYLVARIAGRPVVIDSEQVESVIDLAGVTDVPLAPGHVRGISALRSRVVTVIDSRAALGLSPSPEIGRAVITQVDGHHYAVMVEELEDVVPFAANPLTDGIALDRVWRKAGRGYVERDGEPILIVDVECLVHGDEKSD
ncbi:chemotaxis protein CheW [Stakelama sp. CBK3Z-3]|uniref:Chemotaxis protein CheW n=1 Tax=Stakelama flava TaxID=2860338 RepID=A0ABS6XH11_9SPHN|nr:chemotaxis protein CheW [Stakelama flava]MBW4329495.1 chemotaxis protein CheW [Stakelama flava]